MYADLNHWMTHILAGVSQECFTLHQLVSLPKKHRIMHAKLRDYTAQCPATDIGSYCSKDGTVIPRGGLFPEGVQPGGLEGWTRELAMEPIELGPLIGTDAEIRLSRSPIYTTPFNRSSTSQ